MVRNLLTTPAVFWASIVIALFGSGEAAMYFWFALFPVNIVVGRIGRGSSS